MTIKIAAHASYMIIAINLLFKIMAALKSFKAAKITFTGHSRSPRMLPLMFPITTFANTGGFL